jgi:hypothetical protein
MWARDLDAFLEAFQAHMAGEKKSQVSKVIKVAEIHVLREMIFILHYALSQLVKVLLRRSQKNLQLKKISKSMPVC